MTFLKIGDGYFRVKRPRRLETATISARVAVCFGK
jgi:hypothetical protein